MNFDRILQQMGGSGRALMFLVLIAFANQIIVSLQTMSYVFMKGNDDYRCLIPICENETSAKYKSEWLNYTIPYEHDAKTDKMMLSRCSMYDRNDTSDDQCNLDAFDDSSSQKCNRWVYSLPEMTLNKEWNLVCDKSYQLDLTMSIYAVGFLIGVLLSGFISDKIGRRKTILICVLIHVLSSAIVIFSTNFYMFTIVRLFIAASGIGLVTTLFVLVTEFCTANGRVYSTICLLGWQVGEFVLVGLAYFIRDWRYLQAAISGTTLFCCLYFWFLLESPRWLISQGRYDEAKQVIRTYARWQKIQISDDLFEEPVEKKEVNEGKQLGILTLFKTPEIRKRFFIISFIWFTNSLIGYSIGFGAGNLPGSIYVNFTLIAAADLGGSICSVFFVKYVKRKSCIVLTFLTISVVCLSNVFVSVDQEIVIVGSAVTGIFLISIAFNLTYVYTAELFPTPIRSSALGSASTCSRFGGIAAPFVASLVNVWRPLPTLIMGSAGVISCFIVLFLTETINCELPKSVEEIENCQNKGMFSRNIWSNKEKKDVSIELKSVTYTVN